MYQIRTKSDERYNLYRVNTYSATNHAKSLKEDHALFHEHNKVRVQMVKKINCLNIMYLLNNNN